MPRLFTGDFSTGDFSQWDNIWTKDYVGDADFYAARRSYSAQVIPTSTYGYEGRFELRPGDCAAGVTTERSEVEGLTSTFAPTGATRYYAWSTKFDAAWTNQQHLIDWLTVVTWRSSSPLASATVQMGWPQRTQKGFVGDPDSWYLNWFPQQIGTDKQPGPGLPGVSGGPILALPLNRGTWNDLKVMITVGDMTAGRIKVWHNGVPQKFDVSIATSGVVSDGGTTFHGQTVPDGTPSIGFRQGLYRGETNAATPNVTSVVSHTGARIADDEGGL